MKEKKEITIKQLIVFNEVFECSSVTKAAQNLKMPQPSVSRTLREIEENYNVRLFERMMKKIVPTPDGKKLYAQTVHLVEYYRKIDKKLFSESSREVLRVGASVRLGSELIPKMLMEFAVSHPNVEVEVKIANQKELEDRMITNELDLVFCEGIHNADQFISQKVAEGELTVVVPAGHKLLSKQCVVLEDLTNYPLLVREEGANSRELLKNVLRAHGLYAKPTWESISTDALIKGVYNGFGISVLPKSLVKKNVEKGLLFTVDVAGRPFVHNLYALWHKNKFVTDVMNDMVDICKSIYQNRKN